MTLKLTILKRALRGTLMSSSLLLSVAAMAGAAHAADGGSLTIYNSQDEGPVEAVVAAFEKKTGIKVSMRDDGAPALAHQIIEEGAKTPADIFYAEYSSALVVVGQKDLLSELPAETYAAIPANYSDEKHNWVGTTARSFVVLYNNTMIDEQKLPPSILDFAKPEWKDKVAYNPRAAAFLELVVAVEKTVGREAAQKWLAGLKENGKIYPKNTAMVLAVDRGEVETAINADNYWIAVAQEQGADSLKARVHYIGHKDPGALITVSGAAILKYAPHRAEAEKFMAFLVSEEGQKLLTTAAGDAPLRPGVVSPVALKPFADLDPSPVTSQQIGDASEALDLERAVGIN